MIQKSGQFLCAYFAASDNVDITELTEHLKKKLAAYMVPSVFMQLDKIPLTSNGKVDKKSLPEPKATERRTVGAEAKTDNEKLFCDMFSSALGLDKVYADDDFFEIGGTSLSASKIAMKCMTMKLPIVYKDVFDYSTPCKLAAFLDQQQGTKQEKTIQTAIVQTDKREDLYDVLKHNCSAEVDDITYTDIGTVLVTGATGFLGIHVVRKLIDSDTKKIYCLVRKGHSISAEDRLKLMLMYYFDNDFSDLFGSRLIACDGDITEEGLADKLAGLDFDTVINCAVCVKHFSNSDILERVNVHGVENLIDICLKLDKKLVQVSTASVAGTSKNGSISENVVLRENMLDFGQSLENRYVNTKWQAERAFLTAVRDKGLRGKIVRVGNLMSRNEDGEFQANFRTNGFMNRLRAFAAVGCFPVSLMDSLAEFSAIDSTAQAIIQLAGTPDKFTVFHANSCHPAHLANVIAILQRKNISIDIVSAKKFDEELAVALADEKRNMLVSALISYNTHDASQRIIDSDNSFTVKALYRLGFSWPLISESYIEKAMDALITLGFFDSTVNLHNQ